MSTVPDRLTAALSDRYRIERELGQGGMATVYLAEDVKHKRKVALKVLKPELAAVLGAERFLQEITTTAALQHPHILPLFDSGTADGFLFYVMPFIDGETLRSKLDRETQLGVDESVKITTEVADALHYAHTQGVIHRDIKPENILLHNGRPMVADFGIALAVSAAAGGRMTETGLSLGTPHYMSPEQATAEKELSARSDVYSLGSVLYEMLTGNPPHTGASAQQIIMKIVTEEAAPVTKLRKAVPPNVAAAVAMSLEKLPADRFESAKAFAEALGNAAFRNAGGPASGPARTSRALAREPAVLALAGIAGALLVAVAALTLGGDEAQEPAVARFTVELRDETGGFSSESRQYGPGLAISDDGSRFAYLGTVGAQPQILVRRLDQLDPDPVRATGDVRCCQTFSPDGLSLAYITTQLELKVVSLQSGISRTVADSGLQDPSLYGTGLDWGPDNLLYVAMVDGIWRFAPDGGSPDRVTTLGQGERTHAWMDVLPNGKGALLTVIPTASGDLGGYVVGVVDFADGHVTVLFPGTYARYAASGHIVFVQADGTLLAVPVDQDRLAVTGTPVVQLAGVEVGSYGAARLALSPGGTLVYRRGRRLIDALTWVDRNGTILGPAAAELDGDLGDPRLSPDGSRFAVNRLSAEGRHLWTRAVAGGEPTRHTFEGQQNWRAKFSQDGRSLYFISDRDDAGAVFVTSVDATDTPRRLALPETRPIFELLPVDDSTLIIRTDNQAPGRGDILLVRMGVDTRVTPLVVGPAQEITPVLSPDSRWLAYTSDESGVNEVYVRPFPRTADGVFKISRAGGTEPRWSGTGSELFFRDGSGAMVSASVVTSPTFRVLSQQELFSALRFKPNTFAGQFDVTRDGQRFLMIDQVAPATASEMIAVLNWLTELRAVVPR
jgi:Tol biopolymer transport system component/tRNA A-37 threonylcarbamoyl transferase component Bud32